MAKKIKVSRKKIKRPDEFLTFTDQVIKYLNEHKNLSLGVLGGLVAALVITNVITYTLKTRKANADKLLVEAFAILSTPLSNELSSNPVLKGSKSYASGDERSDEAIKKLSEVIKQFGNREAGMEAKFHLAEAYLNKGDYAHALSSYQDFLKELAGKPTGKFLEYPAYLGMAKAYYQTNDNKNAELYFQKVLDSKQDAYSAEANLGQARILIKDGQVDQAREILDNLIKTYPGSIYDQLAQIELGNLAGTNAKAAKTKTDTSGVKPDATGVKPESFGIKTNEPGDKSAK